MMKNHKKLLAIIALCSITVSLADARTVRLSKENASYIEKFHAHDKINKLSKENLRLIEFIEVISNNFGIIKCREMKRAYWSARIRYIKGEVVKASKELQKNREDIEKGLQKISAEYEKVTKKMIDESILKICELHIEATSASDYTVKRKLIQNQDRLKNAYGQYLDGITNYKKQRYVASVNLYRSTKDYVISILQDIAKPDEKAFVKNKYKIDIVDNKNVMYQDRQKPSS